MVIIERDFSKNDTQLASEGSTALVKSDADVTIEELLKELDKLNEHSKDIIDCKSRKRVKDIQNGEKFYGTITTTIKDPTTGKKVRTQITSTFEILDNKKNSDSLTVNDLTDGKIYKTSRKGTNLRSIKENIEEQIKRKKIEEELKKKEEEKRIMEKLGIDFSKSDTVSKIRRTIEAGIKNIWLCGPAGSGNKRY